MTRLVNGTQVAFKTTSNILPWAGSIFIYMIFVGQPVPGEMLLAVPGVDQLLRELNFNNNVAPNGSPQHR